MLLKTDHKSQSRSTYKCDRCGKEVDVRQKVGIYIQKYLSNARKCCDLCLKCYAAFDRGIKKGNKND